jgi:hypothetical protein
MTASAEISRRWCAYFRSNRLSAGFPVATDGYRLSRPERRAIERSIQQFQLGEGSKGKRLLRRGLAYSRTEHDAHFLRALYLFIQEEQRHSACLLEFMRHHGIEPLQRQWVDSVFRFLRGLAGLELSLRVLVTAEIIAIPYYRALRNATNSPQLQEICSRILADEVGHLRFQASMLSRLKPNRSAVMRRSLRVAHRAFLIVTAFVVWREHRQVFIAARCTMRGFLGSTWKQMNAFLGNFPPGRHAQTGRVAALRP